MTVRIEFTVSDEMADKIDRTRGQVPRATWIKATLDQALSPTLAQTLRPAVVDATPRPAPYQDGAVQQVDAAHVPTSAETKRNVEPRTKKVQR
jgi:hypothetical protein